LRLGSEYGSISCNQMKKSAMRWRLGAIVFAWGGSWGLERRSER
jgi:hypothetical protein